MNAKQNKRLNQLIRETLRIMPDTFTLILKCEEDNDIVLSAEVWDKPRRPIEFMVSDGVAGVRSTAISFDTLDEADMFYDRVVEVGWSRACREPGEGAKRHTLGRVKRAG